MGKIASQSQWQDLANKVKAKQDKLTAGTGIDAASLASDTVAVDDTVVMYITPGSTPGNTAFVNTANIVDGAVTPAKFNFASFGNKAFDGFNGLSDIIIGTGLTTIIDETIDEAGEYLLFIDLEFSTSSSGDLYLGKEIGNQVGTLYPPLTASNSRIHLNKVLRVHLSSTQNRLMINGQMSSGTATLASAYSNISLIRIG